MTDSKSQRIHNITEILKHAKADTLIAMESDLSDMAWRQCGPNPNQDIDLADIGEWRRAIHAELELRKEDA